MDERFKCKNVARTSFNAFLAYERVWFTRNYLLVAIVQIIVAYYSNHGVVNSCQDVNKEINLAHFPSLNFPGFLKQKIGQELEDTTCVCNFTQDVEDTLRATREYNTTS